jgi:hypothetical protein
MINVIRYADEGFTNYHIEIARCLPENPCYTPDGKEIYEVSGCFAFVERIWDIALNTRKRNNQKRNELLVDKDTIVWSLNVSSKQIASNGSWYKLFEPYYPNLHYLDLVPIPIKVVKERTMLIEDIIKYDDILRNYSVIILKV